MKKQKNGMISGFLESKYNRMIVIILEITALLTVVVLTCAVLNSKMNTKAEDTTLYVLQNITASETSVNSYETHLYQGQVPQNNVTGGAVENIVTQNNAGNNAGNYVNSGSVTPDVESQNSQSISLKNPSGWSKAQIIAKATDAVNKTKSYKDGLTVQHRETFDATVTEASGGAVVQSVANAMVGWVVQPVDETLNYQNGTAVNSEGETVPVILPKKNGFYLDESGATSASVKVVNNEYVINIGLVEESVGMHEVPKYNASAIGYLDVANFDLSFLTVDSADITYKGSSLELHINAQGYVTYAEYHIPLNIVGSGHSGSISGSVTFDGEQTEVWTLSY